MLYVTTVTISVILSITKQGMQASLLLHWGRVYSSNLTLTLDLTMKRLNNLFKVSVSWQFG